MIRVLLKLKSRALPALMIAIVAAGLLTACVHLDVQKNINALEKIQIGDSQEFVAETMGPPDIRSDITDRRFLLYYQTHSGKAPVTAEMCTPIAIEDGKVVALGEDLAEVWRSEEAARIRQAERLEQERRMAAEAAAARHKAEQERLQKIADLEKEVKPVPASNAALNLKLYRQLLELDPGNSRYQKKVAFYEARLDRQARIRAAQAARATEQKKRKAWDQARDKRNQRLRQYSGNGIAEMAVHDMGPGSMYVWIKNVSQQVITTHPDHFTFLDRQGRKTRCTISPSLDSVLEPGSISHGKIEYDESVYPGELVFRNREAGLVSKSFE
jgi:hypothetical protein